MDARLTLALAAGKLTGAAVRRLNRGGGTTLPGRISAAIDGGALQKVSARLAAGALLVTGTNGKTTTATLLRCLLEGTGVTVLGNRAGANLVSGLTSATVAASDLGGRPRAEFGVFEVDEASLPAAVEAVSPRLVIVTNLFRDQLDRYGELEASASAIAGALAALPAYAQVVLCADDPTVAALADGVRARVRFFGVDADGVGQAELPHAADARVCPRCGEPLDFSRVYVGHMGHYRCPNGHFERPEPDLSATAVDFHGLDAQVITTHGLGMESEHVEVPISGLYNTYNVLAAVAAGLAVGVPPQAVAPALRQARPAFGRMETVAVEGRTVRLLLAKNPAGFNEVLRTSATLGQGRRFLVAVNDRIADGRDVSWIWDADFELLRDAEWIVLSGTRALDMAIRLKYAGVDADKVAVVEAPPAALSQSLVRSAPGEDVFVLATYTAMLDLRAEMNKRGYVGNFWEAV